MDGSDVEENRTVDHYICREKNIKTFFHCLSLSRKNKKTFCSLVSACDEKQENMYSDESFEVQLIHASSDYK